LPFIYSGPKSRQFFERLLAEVQRHPQVRSAALGTRFPLYGDQAIPSLRIEGQPIGPHEGLAQADWVIVSPEYFKTLGIALLRGRMFDLSDTLTSPPVTVISRSMARRHWPGQSPLGRRLSCSLFGDDVWFTVIGVVDDIRQAGVNVEPSDIFYVSYLQADDLEMSVLARTAGDPALLVNDIRRAVHALDPEQPVADIQTLRELRDRSIAPSRLTAVLLIVAALLAFSIAALGLSAVVAFVVGQRTPEIGLRLALGAERNRLLGMVLRQGMTLMVLGLGLGWAAALAGSRLHLLSTLLFRTRPADPLTFVSASLVLLVCGCAACFFPARRAAAIDPVTALRS
jgi:putative ABC transport system permease protein